MGHERSKVKVSSGNKVKVKYRHPEDASLEWTGRGRKPKWVEAWLVSGKNMEALGI
ncbi:MAG: H-NS histone family protein [Dechloromonas sp.]|uniref:H-NS histone family protein n=1 Tax=Candidatus Dechloromonas phosphorivorans TaxID=2899244 RepID=A0A935MWV2_9RHOO|nr:H-NS histone family protein [Candidatus Dechloromonas phosphorivorans]